MLKNYHFDDSLVHPVNSIDFENDFSYQRSYMPVSSLKDSTLIEYKLPE